LQRLGVKPASHLFAIGRIVGSPLALAVPGITIDDAYGKLLNAQRRNVRPQLRRALLDMS
jgi:hypothetical protein